jgi:hypothetical protein
MIISFFAPFVTEARALHDAASYHRAALPVSELQLGHYAKFDDSSFIRVRRSAVRRLLENGIHSKLQGLVGEN